MRRKILTMALAAAVAVSMALAPAGEVSAAGKWTAPTSSKTIDPDVITTAGHRAAQTLVEIVGLNNTACQNMAGNPDGITDGAGDQPDPAENLKSLGGYYDTTLEAGNNCKILGVFGSDLNSNPDPYYYNYYYNLYAENTDGVEKVADGQYILCIDGSLSPNIADTKPVASLGNVSASVYMKPDILIGSSTKNAYTSLTYAEYIKALRSGDTTDLKLDTDATLGSTVTTDYASYNPIVFTYSYESVYEEGVSLQRLASDMDNISTKNGSVDTDSINSHKGTTGRYGDPMVTANDYQLYIKGLSAYVSKKIKEQGIAEKKVVVIDACSDRDAGTDKDSFAATDSTTFTAGSGWFRAYDNTTKTGLAKRARGAECVENVTENLLTTYKEDSSRVIGYTAKSDGQAYAVSEAVVKEADVIILQGVQANDVMTKAEFESYMKTNYGWTDADLAAKTIIDANPDCVYGLTCNSSETALGYGYYMGYIYPEILDPVDAVAYFYKKCLHITDETALQKFMDVNVANAVSNMADSSTKLSDNWEATIRADINEGVNYFQSLSNEEQERFAFVFSGDIPAYIGTTVESGIFTSYDEKNVNSILYSDGEVKDSAKVSLELGTVTYDGTAKQPAVTVTVDGAVISPSNYTVEYKNNVEVGTATVTVKGKGAFSDIDLSTTFQIVKSETTTASAQQQEQTISVPKKVAAKKVKASVLKKKAVSFKLKAKTSGDGKLTYKVVKAPKGMKKRIKVNKAGKVILKKGAKKGKYKIQITAAATEKYKEATKTITIKVK